MINLLPPVQKEQIRYAKLNQAALRYLRTLVTVLVALSAIFGASIFLLNQQADNLAKTVAAQQQDIAKSAPDMKLAKEAADRLTAVKAIQASQTRFSLLLSDLAKVLPKGVSIDSITLTGDDTKPVRITVTGNSYEAMLAFRNAVAGSPRISGVDLENITSTNTGFTSSVVIAFKKGQAK